MLHHSFFRNLPPLYSLGREGSLQKTSFKGVNIFLNEVEGKDMIYFVTGIDYDGRTMVEYYA